MTALPPIRREVLVDADPARAFAVFTDGLGDWWPLGEHGVFGAGATVAFEDGAIVERSSDGRQAEWGTVTRWEPAHAVAFTWYPGKTSEAASTVTVTFSLSGSQTLVTLEHSGWEVYADPAAARDEYGHGWPTVLERYQDAVAADGGFTWVALLHRPGRDASDDVFTDARFGSHVEFLRRMAESGYLVAAGPLGDAVGEGMTVLRLPGSGRFGDAVALATQDDLSVVGGLFDVTVRPWQVIMQPA